MTIKITDILNGVMTFDNVRIKKFSIDDGTITIIEKMLSGEECLFEFPLRYTKSIMID